MAAHAGAEAARAHGFELAADLDAEDAVIAHEEHEQAHEAFRNAERRHGASEAYGLQRAHERQHAERGGVDGEHDGERALDAAVGDLERPEARERATVHRQRQHDQQHDHEAFEMGEAAQDRAQLDARGGDEEARETERPQSAR